MEDIKLTLAIFLGIPAQNIGEEMNLANDLDVEVKGPEWVDFLFGLGLEELAGRAITVAALCRAAERRLPEAA